MMSTMCGLSALYAWQDTDAGWSAVLVLSPRVMLLLPLAAPEAIQQHAHVSGSHLPLVPSVSVIS